jgi:predicted nucleic acid-binding protein
VASVTHLIDTSVLVDYVRQTPSALAFMKSLRGKPSISVVSIQELYAGAHTVQEERRIEASLPGWHIHLVTIPIARSAGQHMRHFAPSHGLDDLDAIIAATAEHHQLPLATLNVKHFPMFRRLKRAY